MTSCRHLTQRRQSRSFIIPRQFSVRKQWGIRRQMSNRPGSQILDVELKGSDLQTQEAHISPARLFGRWDL
ncbi:Hypothetical predicted protein [Xyrichtys novacula]|uniref:Uncharacterized protein n=1 Tax=Xyrichtys novacula TaxID=13765 RepID=A0AAV1GB14_XYRNO|nr:Hypothetical predicted protein [Xyrichtys novacula]